MLHRLRAQRALRGAAALARLAQSLKNFGRRRVFRTPLADRPLWPGEGGRSAVEGRIPHFCPWQERGRDVKGCGQDLGDWVAAAPEAGLRLGSQGGAAQGALRPSMVEAGGTRGMRNSATGVCAWPMAHGKWYMVHGSWCRVSAAREIHEDGGTRQQGETRKRRHAC